nr:DUF1236 domain-containing protein [Rhizobium leguminosarum]
MISLSRPTRQRFAQYEGYRFFIIADGRIVIVDPDALTIVYIIDV